ncbi:hypothetical protein LOD99_7210 [Oopsacas minuta]|uniref:Uncharacterized protein n=1 Tax=Oopsacas minuta TaxID=111878 RepID=A0AAV7JU19_9METZ|nr:hypothetical protein LOD99_7210 [Oopsacas minuta]
MTDTVYQTFCQQKQQQIKFKLGEDREKRKVLQFQSQTFIRQNELRMKDAQLTQLKRRPSQNYTRSRSVLTRQTSFNQKSTQTEPVQIREEVEFSIITLESSTIGLEYEISILQKNYKNIEMTKEVKKQFVKDFMALWRRVEETEAKYQLLIKALPVSHEYTQSRKIKCWLVTLRKRLWKLREETGEKHKAYELKRKEEEQQRMLEEYFGWSYGNTERNYASSPVESDFGSDMSICSSESSYSSC